MYKDRLGGVCFTNHVPAVYFFFLLDYDASLSLRTESDFTLDQDISKEACRALPALPLAYRHLCADVSDSVRRR
jgi:hypothetical protein